MPEEYTMYRCAVCRHSYEEYGDAAACEAQPVDYCGRKYEEGDTIFFMHQEFGFLQDTSAEIARLFVEPQTHRAAYVVRTKEPRPYEEIKNYEETVGGYNPHVHGAVGIVVYREADQLNGGFGTGYYCFQDSDNYKPSLLMDIPRLGEHEVKNTQ